MWNKNAWKDQGRRMPTRRNAGNLQVTLWALLFAVTALGVATSAQWRREAVSGLTVYADINFGGPSASFRDDTSNLVSAGWNDNISSIRVPNGETWEVCQDVNYGNRCQALSDSVADLRAMGWNDRISSLRRINNGRLRDDGFRGRRSGGEPEYSGIGVTVYADPDFRGQSATLRNATPNLVPYGVNDKISSIRIPGGEAWEVCQDINYGNRCQVLSSSVADLRSMGWNDRISSLRRVDNSEYRGVPRDRRSGGVFQSAQQGLLFFDRPGYKGSSTLVTGGSSNVRFLARRGSVQLRGGGTWELCDSSESCVTINQDVSDVSDLGLNDRITSARIVNTSVYRRN